MPSPRRLETATPKAKRFFEQKLSSLERRPPLNAAVPSLATAFDKVIDQNIGNEFLPALLDDVNDKRLLLPDFGAEYM